MPIYNSQGLHVIVIMLSQPVGLGQMKRIVVTQSCLWCLCPCTGLTNKVESSFILFFLGFHKLVSQKEYFHSNWLPCSTEKVKNDDSGRRGQCSLINSTLHLFRNVQHLNTIAIAKSTFLWNFTTAILLNWQDVSIGCWGGGGASLTQYLFQKL